VEIAEWRDQPELEYENKHPQRFEKERLQIRDYQSTLSLIGRLHPKRGKLLEVGSSLGFLLDFFRKDGWRVTGVEPDKGAMRHATKKLHIETINAILEDAAIPDESVDVVVMLHVIEHVPDPVGTFREIFRVLKSGGHAIVETPRYDSLMFKLFGRRERSLSCDGHIFFFTTDSLRKVYAKAGFAHEQTDYVGRSLTLDRLVYNLAVISKSATIQRVAKAVSRRLNFQKVAFTINVRDMQRICVRKP